MDESLKKQVEQAGEGFLALLDGLAVVYAQGLAVNMEEKVIFNMLRDKFVERLNITPLQAANHVRLVLHRLHTRCKVQIKYSPKQLEEILTLAIG